MKVVQRKEVKAVRVQVRINIPAWVYKELGFQPGDREEWIPLEDDNGERMVALRRIPKKVEGEEEEVKEGEEK